MYIKTIYCTVNVTFYKIKVTFYKKINVTFYKNNVTQMCNRKL